MRLCRLSHAEPYVAANLRSLPALDFDHSVEYCNSPQGSTTLAKMREAAGFPEPFNVRYWVSGMKAGDAAAISCPKTMPRSSAVSRPRRRILGKIENLLLPDRTVMMLPGYVAFLSRFTLRGTLMRTLIFAIGPFIATPELMAAMLFISRRRIGTICSGVPTECSKSYLITGLY